MRAASSILLCTAASGLLSGCRTHRVHANLTTPELHARLAERFAPGMTPAEVETALDELGLSRRDRQWYEDEPAGSRSLLARAYTPRGTWVDSEDEIVRWVDIVMVFSPKLASMRTHEGGVRYLNGWPTGPHEEEPMWGWRRYPALPPPPKHPPEGAVVPLERSPLDGPTLTRHDRAGETPSESPAR